MRLGWVWALALVLCGAVQASEIPKEEIGNLHYGTWKMPSSLSVERLERLIRHASASLYGRGFRYLGETGDFFHGHLLVEERGKGQSRSLIARAILYHTQEDARAAHWGEHGIDKKYDYVDRLARNWIQWLSDDPNQDGIRIENALRYLDVKTKKNPEQFFGTEPDRRFAYTIHAHNLDSERLGFQQLGALQFEFLSANCEAPETAYSERGPIQVTVPEQGRVCLKLSTTTGFIEKESFSNPVPAPAQLAAF